jgi:hypothetical protein
MAIGALQREHTAWRRDQREAKSAAVGDRQRAAEQNFLDLWRLIAGAGTISTREILADAALKDALHIAMSRPATMTPTLVSRYLSRLPAVEKLADTKRGGVRSPQWRLDDCG